MVKVRDISTWVISASMLFGKSPKIEYTCGNCGEYNSTRISLTAIRNEKSYVVCAHCGEINDTGLRI